MLKPEISRVPTGRQAARDEVLGRLGAGGMAEVWLLRRRGVGGFEKYFALKRIRSELLEQSAHVAMFLDEARLAAMLHHPGIVQVFDIGEDELGFWYVMEYVRGRSASQVLRQARQCGKPLPIECAVYIGQQLARALHYAHHLITPSGPLGLVHRDVSPGNVLLGFDGAVKLADFGVARASGRLIETVGGEFKGKYVYASPEQLRGERIDSRSDLFSLGLVVHELITGVRVFNDAVDSPYAATQAVLHAPIRPPSASQPGCSGELDDVVLRAVQRDVEQRFATGAELAAALDSVVSRLGGRASSEGLAAYLADLYGDEARAPVPANLEPRSDPVVPRSVVTGESIEIELVGSVGSEPSASKPGALAAGARRDQRRTDSTALVASPNGGSETRNAVGGRGGRRSPARLFDESAGERAEPSASSETGVVRQHRSRYWIVAALAALSVVAAIALGVTLGRAGSGDRPVPTSPGAAPQPAAVHVPAAAVPTTAVPEAAAASAPAPAVVDGSAGAAVDSAAIDPGDRPAVGDLPGSAASGPRGHGSRRKMRHGEARSAARASSSTPEHGASTPEASSATDAKDGANARDATPSSSDLLEGIRPWTP